MKAGKLPDFALEVFFSRWEFAAKHHLTASDAESMTIRELLALDGEGARERLLDLELAYIPTFGTDAFRAAVAATYDAIRPDDVLAFAGAGESLYWGMQVLLEPGDHAVVTVPNYQSIESVPLAAGIEVDGWPLWSGEGDRLRWGLDLERLEALLRPSTRVVAVNFPNNPTGFVPDATTWARLVSLCDERGIRLFSDEVYRGIEGDPARRIQQAADLSPNAVSVNVLSKAYGLPGLRVGWVACRDAELLQRFERAKHYTSICNAAPGELLATVALRHRETILERNRAIVLDNSKRFQTFCEQHADRFEFTPPDGGCVAFPRYTGEDGVEAFCRRALDDAGVMLLPASIYASKLATVPADRFRVGLGRRAVPSALAALERVL